MNINGIINSKSNIKRYADFITYYKVAKRKGLTRKRAVEYAQAMTASIFYKAA